MQITVLLFCVFPPPIGGLSLLNEDANVRVFFPRNSFVTNPTLTPHGHIACYGGSTQAAQVTWHNSSGGPLALCRIYSGPAPCESCGSRCVGNGGVGVDPPLNGSTDIHMYTDSPSYVNQDLECRVSGGPSSFIGVYLVAGGEFVMSLSNPTVQIIQHLGPSNSHI